MWWERISTAKTNFSNNNYQQPTDRIEQSSAANVSREQSSCCKVYEFRIGKVNFVRQFWCCCAICNNADCTFNYNNNNNCNTWTDCSSRIQIAHTLTLNFLAERRLQWKKSLSSHHFEWAQQKLTPQQQKERERNAATAVAAAVAAAAEVAAATLTSTLFLISAAAEKSVWGAERRTLQLFDRKNSLKTLRALACVCVRERRRREEFGVCSRTDDCFRVPNSDCQKQNLI